MRKIKLTQGKYALVDDADYELLNQWKWQAAKTKSGKFLAVRNDWTNCINSGRKSPVQILMHRFIMGVHGSAIKVEIDHINQNSLDNRRSNMRTCSHKENMRNKGKQKSESRVGHPKYKGLVWNEKRKGWYVLCKGDEKREYVGLFKDAKVAARAYDEAAKRLHGEFASLNFPI